MNVYKRGPKWEYWYDRSTRCWWAAEFDEEGNQQGEAIHDYTREGVEDAIDKERGLEPYLEAHIKLIELGNHAAPEGWQYTCIQDFVLQRGQGWVGSTRPAAHECGRLGECFKNAVMLAVAKGWAYVEGYSVSVIPMAHAWCIDDTGRVVDPTWDESSDRQYFGVPMDPAWALAHMTDRGAYGVLDDWERDFPVVSGKVEITKP